VTIEPREITPRVIREKTTAARSTEIASWQKSRTTP
jgi:hypothetical protein